ncbi:chondroitin sulfate proteoglycan 4-like isoform X2 [Betta splendens]|uniref:Chondroitin sulfate proteoglycan 4-like isoform X2 n=1 Tax=Betta splendens TaxID=158456 RepID=A0A9W2Y657_BETSP|nr:chondroitin sulfate proteoglycan 4-like isoform X2 [Betta splendens]
MGRFGSRLFLLLLISTDVYGAGRRDFVLLELISGRLQARLDLGSGERSLLSEQGVCLSDLAWHSVELIHHHHHVTMTVDRNSRTSARLPDPDVELSVDRGLFVGAAAGLEHPYLVNISTGFRGCVDEAVFNEHNLLSSLKSYSTYKRVHEVSLGCSAQFSATEEDPVSFFSSKSFMALAPWEVPQEGVIECELYPPAKKEDGLVLYSSSHNGFVAVAIKEGHLVATVGTREGSQTELRSSTNVQSNHMWHPIQLQLLPQSIQLKVGEELIKTGLSPELRGVRLKGPLFLGGLDEEARREARRAGLVSASTGRGTSFKGCLRDLRVNAQRTGLPHAAVTKDVTVGCKTGQPPETVTAESPTDQSAFATATQEVGARKKNSSFLLLRRLEVAEGGRVPLEPKHIKVNLDIRKLGIRPSQLMFSIEEQPVHGQLRLDSLDEGHERTVTTGAEEKDLTFSMLDLWHGRVMYIHSGSEDQNDFFMFSVFASNKKELPGFLKGNRLLRFDISIIPVNDAPVLSLPEGNILTLLQRTKQQLTTDILRVSDPDSRPAELVFSSLGNLSAEAGHLEHKDYPGRAISLFSLQDLEEGKINFVHTGTSTSRLALRVSDGQRLSNTVVLRILAVALEHKLANNTGVEVNQGEACVITTNHLAVQVNVATQAVEIRYNVTELPRFGELQRLHSSYEWRPTTSFSQKLLEKERIRYLSTYRGLQAHGNVTDQFKCNVRIGSTATEEVVVPVTVRWLSFKVTRSKMDVSGAQAAVVTGEDLRVISKGVKLNESQLCFRLLTAPKKGQLLLSDKLLQSNSTFSQKDITDGLVKYELLQQPLDDARDAFSFQVFSTHAESSSYDFRISIKAESTAMSIINKGLSVPEGGSRVISKDVLFTHTAAEQEVQYSVTRSPRHGQIRRINLSNSTSINDNIVSFTNQDIVEERIMYVHDDSETKQDSFTFQILVYRAHKQTDKNEDRHATEHAFNISVQLVNDRRPVRVVDKVFHVARDGQRLMTLDDLRYRDDDSDFEDGWLVYTRRGIPLGELVLAANPSHRLYEFTQRDLEQKKVLFVHRGVSFGRFVLFVSDGKHYVSALMEVMAQDPYLHVENNTGLMVQQGGITTLTSTNLSVFSNLDIRDPREVTFEVFLPPKHGALCFGDEGGTEAGAVLTFTQWDLAAGRLAYRHDGSHELLDAFNVTARAKENGTESRPNRGRREAHLDIGVSVKVYLESHQRPPTVISCRPVVVAEGQNVSVSRGHLEVVHEDSQPSEIVFTVQSPPTLGFLHSPINKQKSGDAEQLLRQNQIFEYIKKQPMTSFTQEDVNQGRVIYHQQTMGSNDSVLLEATNGVTTVGPIRLEVDILPALLPLQVSDLTLDEGSSLLLTSDIIKVASHHFSNMNFLYQVVVPPQRGHLEHSRIPGMPITAFTHTEVEREYISYVHDGSDTQEDNFTIVANQTEITKHSLPQTVHVNINPINDEMPAVTANRGLKVWAGSATEITTAELSAEDSDTSPEALEFIVTPPSNGHLALKRAPSKHILNFTQHHIQSGQLLFVHSGALSGGFHFQVNDGLNFAPRQIFSTSARSLFLTLHRNLPLQVYPGSVTPISERELHVVTNNVTDIRGNPSVAFTVTAPPKLGRLLQRMPDNSTRNVYTFTQRMVDHGVILYDQNKPESVGWAATDAFSFTVSCPPAVLPPHTFTILISYQAHRHDGQHRTDLLNNAGAVVAEGGWVTIDRSRLDASNLLGKVPESHRKKLHILYRVVSPPRHGVLSVQGQNLSRNQPDFSQATLNKFGITYVHDDSETTSDSFTFRAWVAPLGPSSSSSSSSSPAFLADASSSFPTLRAASFPSSDAGSRRHDTDGLAVTETFNITVTPVNDQPPLLRSRAPSAKVVVGERVVLGPDKLQVEDRDTPPEELHYLIIRKPSNGYLTLGERPEPVTSFTQYDINHGRLHFIQKGEPSTGVFYFNVTDGHHRPLYKLFSLEVIKPSVSMENNTGLSLTQGRTAVVLTTNQLAARTNGRSPANVTYTVTTPPRHGRIAINDREVTTFGHEDLQSGRVVYHMTDLSESEDSFNVSASASAPGVDYGDVSPQAVRVSVRPLIYLREPVRVPSGVPVKLGKAMIDASELARISRSDPVFEVLVPPKHGKLVKMTYDPDRASEVLKAFTFRDVVQGRVAIEEILSEGDGPFHDNKSTVTTARGHAPARPLNDSFVFRLKAGNVQPAQGELHFTILPHHQMHHGSGALNKAGRASRQHAVTRGSTHNGTAAGGGRGGGGSHPHVLTHRNHTRNQHRQRPHSRWGNHTGGTSGGRSESGAEGGSHSHSHAPPPQAPPAQEKHGPVNPPHVHPVHVEVLPRPASDPLLIILPLLACLLLIVILVVLILVFRHRKEKQARLQLIQELAAARPPAEAAYLSRPERSAAVPSVLVTPLGPASCPTSPRVPISPRRRSLAPGMTFWGPFESDEACEDGNVKADNSAERDHVGCCTTLPAVTSGFKASVTSRSPTPTLKHSQYWV